VNDVVAGGSGIHRALDAGDGASLSYWRPGHCQLLADLPFLTPNVAHSEKLDLAARLLETDPPDALANPDPDAPAAQSERPN
jgi:hypothetical protein